MQEGREFLGECGPGFWKAVSPEADSSRPLAKQTMKLAAVDEAPDTGHKE